MKKVRNLLILLLAALMLTVFVGCNPDKGLDDGTIPEDDTSTTPEQVFTKLEPGDLIISKYYLGDNNDKMFVISNVGSAEIDLAGYQIGMRMPGTNDKYTSLQKLPAIKLPAGRSLYVVNNHDGSLSSLFKLFPNLKTLPEVKKDDKHTIEEDSFTTAVAGYYSTDRTLEIVTNVGDVIGKDGNFPIYGSWDIVDTVLVEDKIPGRPSALVRNYEAATHTDKGWTNVIEDLAQLNPAEGSIVPEEEIPEDQKIGAEGVLRIEKTYRLFDDMVYVIKNTSTDKYVDLSTVNAIYTASNNAKDTRIGVLPAQCLAPGKSLYMVNYDKNTALGDLKTMPQVKASGKVIAEDSVCALPSKVKNKDGVWGISLVSNITDTGELKDNKYIIYRFDNPIETTKVSGCWARVKNADGNWDILVQATTSKGQEYEDAKVALRKPELLKKIVPTYTEVVAP